MLSFDSTVRSEHGRRVIRYVLLWAITMVFEKMVYAYSDGSGSYTQVSADPEDARKPYITPFVSSVVALPEKDRRNYLCLAFLVSVSIMVYMIKELGSWLSCSLVTWEALSLAAAIRLCVLFSDGSPVTYNCVNNNGDDWILTIITMGQVCDQTVPDYRIVLVTSMAIHIGEYVYHVRTTGSGKVFSLVSLIILFVMMVMFSFSGDVFHPSAAFSCVLAVNTVVRSMSTLKLYAAGLDGAYEEGSTITMFDLGLRRLSQLRNVTTVRSVVTTDGQHSSDR